MQHREFVQAEPALHQHEAHLRAGRPRQPHLDADPGHHHQPGQHRAAGAEHDQQGLRQRRLAEHGGEADHHEAAQVHHAGVQQGRHRGRRLHHLDQPAVHRQQRAAQDRRDREQRGRRLQHRRHLAGRGDVVRERADRQRAGLVPHQVQRDQQARLGQAVGEELLVRGGARRDAFGVEHQQAMQGEAARDPCRDQHAEVVGLDHHAHRGERQQQGGDVAGLARLAGEVLPRVAHDHPAEGRHQQHHQQAQRVVRTGGRQRQHAGGQRHAGAEQGGRFGDRPAAPRRDPGQGRQCGQHVQQGQAPGQQSGIDQVHGGAPGRRGPVHPARGRVFGKLQ